MGKDAYQPLVRDVFLKVRRMTIMQIQKEHMLEIIFNLLINERSRKMLPTVYRGIERIATLALR